jgi:exodeoxyribonuclease X
LPFYMDGDGEADVDVFVAHKWAFETQWLGEHLQGRPAICTYQAALRLWPEAPGHSNQVLRYWLRPKDLNPVIASCAHRALPDAYVTAFLLRELLELATVEELIAWTCEPTLLPGSPSDSTVAVGGTRSRSTTWSGSPTGRS